MKTYPVFKLTACEHKELNKNTPVVNINEVDYYLYVELPFPATDPVRLYSVKEVTNRDVDSTDIYNGDHDDNYQPLIKQDSNHWLKIASKIMNLTAGQHVYRLAFMKADQSDLEIPLYISYIIQDDCPERPYIYMERK